MACGCNKNMTTFQVVMPDGKVVYKASDPVPSKAKEKAQGVAKRYPGAKVEPKPATATKAAS